MSSLTSPARGRIAGRIALITGAASGIGRSTSKILAAEGATVVCADVNVRGAEDTAAQIVAHGGTAQSALLDVTLEKAWQETLDFVGQTHGGLDILVNSAGISSACPIADLALDDWRRVLAINLDGLFLGTKHAIRAMRRGGRAGSIINVASASGIKAQPWAAAYCCSKAAVIMFSKTAALECRKHGVNIRVNCVSPGGVKTPLWRSMPFFQELMAEAGGEEAAFQSMLQADPHSRWAEPEEIARSILFLASDDSSFVTGANLVVDNGDVA